MPSADGPSAPAETIVVVRATIVSEPTSTPVKPARVQAFLSLLVELLKAAAWPLLAFAFFLIFRAPISRTIALVPDKLEKAYKGNIGSLSWEIRQRAQEQGGSELAARVGTLSPGAVEELIKTPRDGVMGFVSSFLGRTNAYTIPSETRLAAFRELESAQFLQFRTPLGEWLEFVKGLPLQEDKSVKVSYGRTVVATRPLTPEQYRKLDEQSYQLTPKGKQAVDAIVKAIGEQLKAD